MEFDERIKTDLVSIGFQEKEGQPVMIENYDGKTYGVDFKKGEIFYLDGVERVSAEDDPADEYLQRLQTFIGKTMGYASKPAAEDEDDPAPDDSMRQQGKSEDEGIQEKLVEPDKSCATPLLDLIARYTGNDVIEVFGNTGSGKSKFAMTAAREAIAAGKKVFYLDTERNLTQADIRDLKGCEYKYTPVIEEIEKIVQDLPSVDVVVIDSIGFPVLTTFARMSVKQKGDALLKLISIFGDLKNWAYRHNGVVVVTNQPESEFNKGSNHVLRPFGDKSQFAAKEIWKTEIAGRTPETTNINISAFRSRSVGYRSAIAKLVISGKGVEMV
jgi:adenosyl cobinamide kinase/adenosyl cobinamide phosphate guanylyltransferase